MITIQAGYAVVIDDEPANRDFLERLLQMAGFKVFGAGTAAEGLSKARAVPQLALALVDQELPDALGIDLIQQMRDENPEAILIMATMHDDRTLIDRAFGVGIDVFLVKPHGFMELFKRLQAVDNDVTLLRQMVIDQYGPRPYRGARTPATAPTLPTGIGVVKTTTSTVPVVPITDVPLSTPRPAIPTANIAAPSSAPVAAVNAISATPTSAAAPASVKEVSNESAKEANGHPAPSAVAPASAETPTGGASGSGSTVVSAPPMYAILPSLPTSALTPTPPMTGSTPTG
ncbi:MAG TPA: response regulator [Aggregatilineales bacterium]|nr:response regulator [Anaerolineales bacterium]HRE49234.1 response regulator [Aggregatilineales bacterium]